MGTLSGEAFLSFPFCLSSQWGSILNGKNLLLYEQILSFKSRPIIRIVLSVKVTGSHLMFLENLPLKNKAVNPCTLRRILSVVS